MSVCLMTETIVHDVEAYEKYKEQTTQYEVVGPPDITIIEEG